MFVRKSLLENMRKENLALQGIVNHFRGKILARDRTIDRLRAKLISMESENTDMAQYTSYSYGNLLNGNDKSLFEIIRKSDGKFVVGPGFETYEEAHKVASDLARSNVNEVFLILAPIAEIKADVPIVSEQKFEPVDVESNKVLNG